MPKRSRAIRSRSRRWSTASATWRATSTSWRRASARRSGAMRIKASDRFAHLDAEIAALKEKLLGIQLTQLISSRTDAPLGSPVTASEVGGLRSSLFELSSAHHNSVAAITRRLDRIEVKVGLSTDVTSPIPGWSRARPHAASRRREGPTPFHRPTTRCHPRCGSTTGTCSTSSRRAGSVGRCA